MNCSLKICGINDASFAVEAAKVADYLGFIFEPSSPRAVTASKAATIRKAIADKVKLVGVFVNHTIDEILLTAREVKLDIIQLHREATDAEIATLHAAGFIVWTLDEKGDGTIVDGVDGTRTGGTGRLADWTRVRDLASHGVFTILAGGLSQDNILSAAETDASVLDVNSSLETSPGCKSVSRLHELVRKVSEVRR